MKNMACYDLRIVARREDLSDEQVRTLAVHAADVWESARFFEPTLDGLKAACADCTVSAGTTRRMGQKRKSWGMTPEQFADHIARSGADKYALVFGNERTGLTDEELDCCSLAINIPSNDDFPSLNLSHAVQLVTYTLFRAKDDHKRGYDAIELSRLREINASISASLSHVGLFQKAGLAENEVFMEGILARAALSEQEARRLEKIFRRMAYQRTGSDPAE